MTQQAPPQSALACSQCGRMFAHSDLVQIAGNWVCGDCKPAFLSRVMVAGPAAAGPFGWDYGGLWIRFGARLLDGLVMMARLLLPVAVLLSQCLPAAAQPSI